MRQYFLRFMVVFLLFASFSIHCLAKSKSNDAYKNGLEVELKILNGNEVNQLLQVSDTHPSSKYIFGSIRNKFVGKTYLQLQIIFLGGGSSSKFPLTMVLPSGLEKSKNYFLIYIGDQLFKHYILNYEILSCTVKGPSEIVN